MRYRRVLLITELDGDSRDAVALVRRIAPDAALLRIVARLPSQQLAWFTHEAPTELHEAAKASLQDLRDAAAGAAQRVEVMLASALRADELAQLAAANEIDLLAVGTLSPASFPLVAELRKRLSIAVLWTAGAPAADHPIARLLCLAPGARAGSAVAAFLRDHGSPALHATVVLHTPRHPDWLIAARSVTGVTADLKVVPITAAPTARPWEGAAADDPIDLVVLPRLPGALARAVAWPAPLLVLPPTAPRARPPLRAIDVPDIVEDAGMLRVRVAHTTAAGRDDPVPDQSIAVVSGGRIVAVVATSDGYTELPAGIGAGSFGLFRLSGGAPADPIAAIEAQAVAIRPGTRPLLLFDAGLPDADLAGLAGLGAGRAPADVPELLAVRMRATRSCREIRARLRAADLAPRVVDASTVLDEGDALDVAEASDPVRLARVAARLRGVGFPVVGIVHAGPRPPRTMGFAAVRATEAVTMRWGLDVPASADGSPESSGSLAARLDATTGAPPLDGNRIEVELDNALARRWLLEAIAASRERVHLQVYMALDDDVGAPVEAALAAAGARGVAVRVLVDSLHGLHGSLGARNPLLERLAARPGVELRVSRPLAGAPSLEALKCRDHRKLATFDGTLALLGGRNLSHEYYTGFAEARLTPASLWREVPWLDAGARVEGPAVAALESAFLAAWREAGGAAFDVSERAAAGPNRARVVVHHGLYDATTLEAYLAIIETARSHVYAVNGFPLMLEIQHALLRALRRGVRVCALFGHLTPRHGGRAFRGPWARARTAATQLVHSRVDALVAAGGEGYQFVVPEQPGWTPGLGAVNPHVHAKVMSADGRVCAVGSANLDITAGYWESELLLVMEDAAIAAGLEARIEQLIAGSQRVDRDDLAWQRVARRRDWMRHWPGVLSV